MAASAMLAALLAASACSDLSADRGTGSSADDGRAPGDTFRDPMANGGEGPLLTVVPGGTFEFGGRPEQEPLLPTRPSAVVTISPFAIGVFETSFSEWDACVADDGCTHWPTSRPLGRSEYPVYYVSWRDAQQYVAWLSRQTGKPYRLPSESEWEYVALAGGDLPDPNQAHLDTVNPWPVDSPPANAFGLHGLYGNVREWVQDCVDAVHVPPPPDGSAWLEGDCGQRILRGGAFDYTGFRQHSTMRSYQASTYRQFNTGFRVARSLEQ